MCGRKIFAFLQESPYKSSKHERKHKDQNIREGIEKYPTHSSDLVDVIGSRNYSPKFWISFLDFWILDFLFS